MSTLTLEQLGNGESAGVIRSKINSNFEQLIDLVYSRGFIWTGTYNSATEYAKNDAVFYVDSLYIAKTPNINISPLNTSAWDFLLSGPQGIKGEQGNPGVDAPNVMFEYSIDGSTLWHSTFVFGDKYSRNSTDGGIIWSSAMKFIGEDGFGSGDMTKSVYDPTNISGDAFDMNNMVEGATKKILTVAERTKLTNTSGTNTGDQTSIVGITGTLAQFNTAVTDADLARTDAANTFIGVQTMTSPNFTTPVLGTPSSGTLTNCTGLPVSGITPSTSTALGVGSVELGHASDTTISRVSSGKIAVENVNVGTEGILQNSQSAAYTLVITDAGRHIYHPSADTTARTWTIPSNASVAFPIGTAVTFVNDTSAGAITIAITTDTLVLAGTGTTGSRTLTANGIATAIKVTSTRWIISGTNLT